MAEKKKEPSSKSSLGNFAFWVLISFGICFLIYQAVIKPAQVAQKSLDHTLPPLIFTLSRTSDFCGMLKDPHLLPSQKEAIVDEIKKVNHNIVDTHANLILSINEAGRALDKEILKLEALEPRIMEQSVSILATTNTCSTNFFKKDKLEQLQKDILNRYPRTWLGILLFKLGFYKLPNLTPDKYFVP